MQIKNTSLKEKREHWIKVRVTKNEKLTISQKAKTQGQTVSAFILFRTLNYRLRKDITHKEKILQLTKIGNNLNQIARWANTHGNKAEAIAVITSLLSLEKQIKTFADTTPRSISEGE